MIYEENKMFSFRKGMNLEINKFYRITSPMLEPERAEEMTEKSLGEIAC